MRGETYKVLSLLRHNQFQSTLPMRGETLVWLNLAHFRPISIHSPHAGRDKISLIKHIPQNVFQSTLPMRGETYKVLSLLRHNQFQSTLPMRGETLVWLNLAHFRPISIHSPHAGRDLMSTKNWPGSKKFQSTLPMRGETCNRRKYLYVVRFQSTLPMRGETRGFMALGVAE